MPEHFMTFLIEKGAASGYSQSGPALYLRASNWDDYSYKTTFSAVLMDSDGSRHDLGQVKIGFRGQGHGWTDHSIQVPLSELPPAFFSLGQGVEYYQRLAQLPPPLKDQYLAAMRDVVNDRALLAAVKDERVFTSSLLRGVNLSSITEQYARVLEGDAVRTDFRFRYELLATDARAGFSLDFEVSPDLKPSRNIHVLIGRNGVGKTTLLNGMISALAGSGEEEMVGQFVDTSRPIPRAIGAGFFSSLISVSFSAFDPFQPPQDKAAEHDELGYCYIGLKEVGKENEGMHKSFDQIPDEFVNSLMGCFGLESKRRRWATAIKYLESDPNFEDIDLTRLLTVEDQEVLQQRSAHVFSKMSSGHKIVLLTITRIIERAEEKTLVVMDEPECHLHPPLLSAFVRAISNLLNSVNGVAIIATHSPVVLQEVPMSCVWKLYRTRLTSNQERPEVETFGENVGVLTRDVFKLEVERSGFYEVLQQAVGRGGTYDEILAEFGGQVGFEGRAILRALVKARDAGVA
jgi:predicted ATPase